MMLTAIKFVHSEKKTKKKTHPFSEKEMLVTLPECPGKLATFALSFKSQILTMLHENNGVHLTTTQTLSDR